MFFIGLLACFFAGAALLSLPLALQWSINRVIDRKQAEIELKIYTLVNEWISSPSEGKPSKLAEITAAAGTVVGQSAAHSIMQSLSTQQSHVTTLAQNVTGEIESQQNPLLAILQGGKRGKGAAVLKLAQLLAPMLQNMSKDNHQNQQSTGLSRLEL